MLKDFEIRTSNRIIAFQENNVRETVFLPKTVLFSWDESNFSDLPAKTITQDCFLF